MTTATTAAEFEAALRRLATEEQRAAFGRYFPGDDSFLGVRMRDLFALAASAVTLPVAELEILLESPVHEARAGACSIMGKAATAKAVPAERHQELYELYLRRHDRIDGWDLVDLAAHQVVGSWLLDKPRTPLYLLVDSTFWPERRTAIVATAAFLKRGQVDDTLRIAAILSEDGEVLVQKAVGWMLRIVGDLDEGALLAHLDRYAPRMSRVAVRASLEKVDAQTRARYRKP